MTTLASMSDDVAKTTVGVIVESLICDYRFVDDCRFLIDDVLLDSFLISFLPPRNTP